MDGANFGVPQVITIQPDSVCDLPEHGEDTQTQIDITHNLPYSTEYSPITVDKETTATITANHVSPIDNLSGSDHLPPRTFSSNTVSLNKNTNFLQVDTGRTLPKVFKKTSQPIVKKIPSQLLVVPTSRQTTISSAKVQRTSQGNLIVHKTSQNNPIVLSIGNLGTITEQRYFNVPVSESQASALHMASVPSSYSGTQISKVPSSRPSILKRKPTKEKSKGTTPIASSETSSRSKSLTEKAKASSNDKDKTISGDKVLGVKQNDIFFCNYCNYYAVFKTTEIFKHYVKHHKKSCTGINCTKQFNTEIEMQQHIYQDHPELRGKLAPKEVFIETTCLETFKKPVFVFSRTSLTKIIGGKDTGVELKGGEEDFLFTEKLFAPPKSYAKFMRQRYPEYNFNFKHLDETSKEGPSSVSHWACPHCTFVNKSYSDVFDHMRDVHPKHTFQPPMSVYSLDSNQDVEQIAGTESMFTMSSVVSGKKINSEAQSAETEDPAAGRSSDLSGPVIGDVRTDTDSPWNSEVSVTVNGLELQATVDSNPGIKMPISLMQGSLSNSSLETINNQLKEAVGSSSKTSDGVNSYLLTQKKASCGHYMPSFDTHRQCKRCRLTQGLRCQHGGRKCVDCEGWSEELWGFVTSMYPQDDEDDVETEGEEEGATEEPATEEQAEQTESGQNEDPSSKESLAKVKKCVCCSFYMPAKDQHKKCSRCRKNKWKEGKTTPPPSKPPRSEKSAPKRKDKTSESPKTPVKNCFVQLQSSPHRDKKMCRSCRKPMFMFDLHNDCESCRGEKGVFCSANGMRCNICRLLGDSYWDTLDTLGKTKKKRTDSSETRQSFDSQTGGAGVSDDEDNDFVDEPTADDESQNLQIEISSISTSNVNSSPLESCQDEAVESSGLKKKINSMMSFNPQKKTYSCLRCNVVKSNRKYMRQHVRTHIDGRQVWTCPYCDFQRDKKSAVHRHIKQVHQGSPVKVVRKSGSAETEWEIAGGFSINNRLKFAKCHDCNKQFSGLHIRSNAKRHIEFKHPGPLFGCELCKFTSKNSRTVEDHISICHPGETCQIISESSAVKPSKAKKIKQEKFDAPESNSVSSSTKENTAPSLAKGAEASKKNKFGCGYCSFSTWYYNSVIRHCRSRHRARPVKVVQRKQGQVEPQKPKASVEPPRIKSEPDKTYKYNPESGWYTCCFCHYKTKSTFAPKLMSVHFRIHHSNEAETFSHKCPHCSYSSLHKPYLARHIKRKHSRAKQTPAVKPRQKTPPPTMEDDDDDNDYSPGLPSAPESDGDDGNDGNTNTEADNDSAKTSDPPIAPPVIIENIHNKYNYLPDSKVASCKICTHTTCGKHALTAMRDHVTGHLDSNLVPVPQVENSNSDSPPEEITITSVQKAQKKTVVESGVDKDYVFNKSKQRAECKKCGFTTRGKLARKLIHNHLKNHQVKVMRTVYVCPHCGLNSIFRKSIIRHQEMKHRGKPISVITKQPSGETTEETAEKLVDKCKDSTKDTPEKDFQDPSHIVEKQPENVVNKTAGTESQEAMDGEDTEEMPADDLESDNDLDPMPSDNDLDLVPSVPDESVLVTPEKNKRAQQYTYLPDTRLASCRLCAFSTQGKSACLDMLAHVKEHHAAPIIKTSPVTPPTAPPPTPPPPAAPEIVYGCSYCDYSSSVSAKDVSIHTKQNHPDLIIKVKVRSGDQQHQPQESSGDRNKAAKISSLPSQKAHKKVDSYTKLKPQKKNSKKSDSNYRHLRKVVKNAKYFLRCPFCTYCNIFPSQMANHIRCVHPDCDQEIRCDSIDRPSEVNMSKLAKLAIQSSCFVKVTRLEHMKRFPALQEILDTHGAVLRKRLDEKDRKWFGVLESKQSESSEDMETEEVQPVRNKRDRKQSFDKRSTKVWQRNPVYPKYAELPNIDEVIDHNGKPLSLQNLGFREKDPLIFANRFRCSCKKTFSDLTFAKIHAIRTHPTVYKSFENQRFKEITDMYAKAKFGPNKTYLCPKPECVFFSKLPSICELHLKCSGNPFRFWGTPDNLLQVMYRSLSKKEPVRRNSSQSSESSPSFTIGEVTGGATDIADLSGPWNYEYSEVTDGMWRISTSNSNFVVIPNIDDIFHIRGYPKILDVARFSKPGSFFRDRFVCKRCPDFFSDLTEAKIHFTKLHPKKYEWFSGVTFIPIKDLATVNYKCKSTVFMCANPGCVFLERNGEKCENHQKCSGNPLQFWGKKSDLNLDDTWTVLDKDPSLNIPSSSLPESESETVIYASLPLPEEVMHLTGEPKVSKKSSSLRKVDFPNRFLCQVCDKTSDDLTDLKKHSLQKHSQRCQKKGNPGLFVAVKDIYAKLKGHDAVIFMCSKPGCAFYAKQDAEILNHFKCSEHWWEGSDSGSEVSGSNHITDGHISDEDNTAQIEDDNVSVVDLPSDSDGDGDSNVAINTEKPEAAGSDVNNKITDSRSESGGAVSPTLSLIEEDLCLLAEGGLDMLADEQEGEEEEAESLVHGDNTHQSSQGESISDTEVPAQVDIRVKESGDSSSKQNSKVVEGTLEGSNNEDTVKDASKKIQDETERSIETADRNADCNGDNEKVATIDQENNGSALYEELSDSDATILNCSIEQNMANSSCKTNVEGDKQLYEAMSDTEFPMDFEESEAENVTKPTGKSEGQSKKSKDKFGDPDKASKPPVPSNNGEMSNNSQNHGSMEEQMKSTGILTTTYIGNNTLVSSNQGSVSWSHPVERSEEVEMESEEGEEVGIDKIVEDIASCSNLFLQPNMDDEDSDILDSILNTGNLGL